MNKVKINLDKTPHSSKPTGAEVGAIQNKIHETHEVTVQELHEVLTAGGSMKMAALTDGAKDVNWTSQQVFALDFDNDEKQQKKYGLITLQDVASRCRLYGLEPAFYYASFSHMTEKDNFVPKFRVVFISDIEITDVRVRSAYMFALMRIFPECDPSCKDLSRLMFGGRPLPDDEVSINYEATVSLMRLVGSMSAFIADTDKPHYAREMKNYCALTAINAVNNLPDIREVDANSNFGEITGCSINIIIEGTADSPKMINIDFNMSEADYRTSARSTETKKKAAKQKINNTKIKAIELDRNFDFNELENNCQLYREFVGGDRWCYHEEVFGMATNLWRMNTGQSRMIDAITSNESYVDMPNKINTITNCSSAQYEPSRCENFCPYRGECQNAGLNMLHAVSNKRQGIRRIEDIETKPLEVASAETKVAIKKAILEKNVKPKLTVIKSGTGIGKTTMLQEIAIEYPGVFNNKVIAAPTHDLLNEVVEKLDDKIESYVHVSQPNVSNVVIEAKRVSLQSAGRYSEAKKLLEDYIQTLINTTKMGTPERQQAEIEINSINSYITSSKQSRTTHLPIFCTHKRALMLGNEDIEKYIIDEDIMSTIVQNISITESIRTDLLIVQRKAIESKMLALETACRLIIDLIAEAEQKVGFVVEKPVAGGGINAKDLARVLKQCDIKNNIMDLLTIKAMVKTEAGQIVGYKVNKLPYRDILIFSATANETVYKNIFKEFDVEFVDIGDIESKGEVVLHHAGMSRSYLEKNFDKAVEKVRAEAPGINDIITYKSYNSKFEKAGFAPTKCHFGKCAGINDYEGKDLIVLGTPHINAVVYQLLAHACGISEETVFGMEYVNTKRNGYEFTFSTFNSHDTSETGQLIREIQFYLIESELIQAVGRARTLRQQCTVHLFSNLPLKGCKIFK